MLNNNDGCKHYLRKCKLISPCCKNLYTCRLCHDEEQNGINVPLDKQHTLNRFSVTNIVCTECNTTQDINKYCTECGILFGKYYCKICRLYDDNIDKKQYHCDKCGICRTGGAENFTHCDKCNLCINSTMFDTHVCRGIVDYDCSICMEPIFDSTLPTYMPKCGHYMHSHCMMEYMKTNFKCPVCSISLYDMTEINTFIDQEIAQTPMPPEYKDTMVNILCNDCHEESSVVFHVIGHKCVCGSYNTRKI
jgi:RING finger/CHY zinc finger protein 1